MSNSIPVILDTDIGDDIDDAYALALILRSPELDLRAVTTVYGNTLARARQAQTRAPQTPSHRPASRPSTSWQCW